MPKVENSKRSDSEKKFLEDSVKYLAKLEKAKEQGKQKSTATNSSSKIKKPKR